MKKKFSFLLATLLLLTCIPLASFAAAPSDPTIYINGSVLAMKAVVQEGTLYLPLRGVSEALGYSVSWSQADQVATLTLKNQKISVNLSSSTVNADSHEYYLLDQPILIHNRTYIRANFYEEQMALHVQWEPSAEAVQLSSVKVNDIIIETAHVTSETKALNTNLQYPVLDGLADKAVQLKLNDTFQGLADQAAQTGLKNAADLAPVILQFPDMPGQCATWFDYCIKYNQNNTLSLIFLEYQYAGGAHGMTVQTGYTYDLLTGKLYSLKELFQADAAYVSVISDQVTTQLLERELKEALFQPFEKINPNQGCYLSNNGVVVFFQQYEILPYAAGIQEFTTSYSQLKAILAKPEMVSEQYVRTVKSGESLHISLEGNPTTGYLWHPIIDNFSIVSLLSETSTVDSDLVGAGSTFNWEFHALQTGTTTITFKYYRSWEGESSTAPEDIVVYHITVE